MAILHVLSSAICGLLMMACAGGTALDDYVWTPDEHYGWVDMGAEYILNGRSIDGKHTWQSYTLNLTSQKYLNDEDYSETSEAKSIWWHMLVVIIPDEIKFTRNATMWITGHGMGYRPTDNLDEDIALAASLAMGVGTITGVLFQVPNEDITFAADTLQMSRGEDEIIAFTWDHYLNDPSKPNWLVRFPMVKAGLRAMDAITESIAQLHPELGCQLDYYGVAGASKRGWTTWDIGAVDPARVMAIVPIVLDAINFVEVEHHQWRSYGGWSWALNDYYEMNIMTRLDTPEMKMLQMEEDPYFYKERLTMPKLVVNAVLDEFQQPDDTHYWWSEMPEPKHFLMTPNAEHSEATGILEIVPAIGTWLNYLLLKETVPQFTWTIDETTGEIVATLDGNGRVHSAHVWHAYSCGANPDGIQRRDFRIMSLDNPCKCGMESDGYCLNTQSFWNSTELEQTIDNGHRTYRALVAPPADGRYVAFFIDIKYEKLKINHYDGERNGGLPKDLPGRLEFTTEVSILPNTFPYDECEGQGCAGKLL